MSVKCADYTYSWCIVTDVAVLNVPPLSNWSDGFNFASQWGQRFPDTFQPLTNSLEQITSPCSKCNDKRLCWIFAIVWLGYQHEDVSFSFCSSSSVLLYKNLGPYRRHLSITPPALSCFSVCFPSFHSVETLIAFTASCITFELSP